MYNVSEEFKNQCKSNFQTYKIGKIYIQEDDITITGDDDLIDFTIEDFCYTNDRFIGTTVSKKISINILNDDGNYNLENKTVVIYGGCNLEDSTEELIPLGTYIIEKSEDETVKKKTSFTGYDYMIKFNTNYQDIVGYPISLYSYLQSLCLQMGMNLKNTSIINGSYQIKGNPFTNNETNMTVLSNIAQLCGGFARITKNNEVEIVTLNISNSDENILDEIDGNNYDSSYTNSEQFGPVNSLIIRLSQVEGENVTKEDSTSIQENGLTEITISDNYFLINEEERTAIIDNIWNSIKGLTYKPFKTDYYGYPYLETGDLIKIVDVNNIEYPTYVFNHTLKYTGVFSGNLETNALSKTQTAYKNTNDVKSKFRNVEYKVDKINGKIETIIEQQTETENKITQAQQDIDGFAQTVASKDEVTEQINELKHTIEGITLQSKSTGGDNVFYYAKEYWRGQTDEETATLETITNTNIQQNTVSGYGYQLNNGTSIQTQVVKNGYYTISFMYYKMVELATGYIYINGNRYDLDVEEVNKWTEKIISIDITTNSIVIELVTDTDGSYYLTDLMVALGAEKRIWSQNANETLTDTVTIGKGIQVESSKTNTYTRIDADGNRTFNSSTNERVAEMTDKGVYAKELEVEGQAKVNLILIKEIDGQAWITGIGG